MLTTGVLNGKTYVLASSYLFIYLLYDVYIYVKFVYTRIAKIEPTVRKPSVSSEHTVQKPAVPPQEDDGGYLQPVDIPKVQYSDQEKIGHEENQYIVLQTAEGISRSGPLFRTLSKIEIYCH